MSTAAPRVTRKAGEPAWEIARLFPLQGAWSEHRYLALTNSSNVLVEFSDGFIRVLPMPTTSHQSILLFLLRALLAFVEPRELGKALFAGIRVRLWKGEFREPDIVFMFAKHADRMGEEYWQGADLVMEVVSGSAEDRKRDLVEKRADYARAKIPEYWIVDPQEAQITVLRLKGKKYVIHGQYGKGEQAKSALLKGFEVDVDRVLAGR